MPICQSSRLPFLRCKRCPINLGRGGLLGQSGERVLPMLQITKREGEEVNPLIDTFADLIKNNCSNDRRKEKRAIKMDCSAVVTATDTGRSVTLMFQKGHLTVIDGAQPRPTLTISADLESLIAMTNVKCFWGFPVGYLTPFGLRYIVLCLITGKIRVKGMVTHLLSLLRLQEVLSEKV